MKDTESPLKLPLIRITGHELVGISGVNMEIVELGDQFVLEVVDFDKKVPMFGLILKKIK